jgi:hypothetical protein
MATLRAGVPAAGDGHGSGAAHAVLRGGAPAGTFVSRHRKRADGNAVEREIPVSHGASARQRRPGTIYKLSDLELASRLSFFLWSSIPDDELLTLAEQNKLSEPKTLDAQVRRMLADARSKTLTTNFAFQWLRVRDTAALDPDPYAYPAFDRPLREAIHREMELFVDSVFREDRSVIDLLSANYTFLNERLARHYGVRTCAATSSAA